jgi:hypothetical protein
MGESKAAAPINAPVIPCDVIIRDKKTGNKNLETIRWKL